MRILLIPAILATIVFSSLPAMAAFEGPGSPAQGAGYDGPISGSLANTVAQARQLADDAPVVLTGKIISQIAGKKDEFIFRDQTGEIRVEIDDDVFAGRRVTQHDTVRISGEVEKDFGKEVEIDVKHLDIVQNQ